jgi:hypothetical protein
MTSFWSSSPAPATGTTSNTAAGSPSPSSSGGGGGAEDEYPSHELLQWNQVRMSLCLSWLLILSVLLSPACLSPLQVCFSAAAQCRIDELIAATGALQPEALTAFVSGEPA